MPSYNRPTKASTARKATTTKTVASSGNGLSTARNTQPDLRIPPDSTAITKRKKDLRGTASDGQARRYGWQVQDPDHNEEDWRQARKRKDERDARDEQKTKDKQAIARFRIRVDRMKKQLKVTEVTEDVKSAVPIPKNLKRYFTEDYKIIPSDSEDSDEEKPKPVKRQRVTAPQNRLRSSGNTSTGNDPATISRPSGETTASGRPTTTPSDRPTTTLSGRPFVDPVPGMTAATQFAKKYKHKPWLDKPEIPTPQSRSDRGPEQPSTAPDGIDTAVPSDHKAEHTASLPAQGELENQSPAQASVDKDDDSKPFEINQHYVDLLEHRVRQLEDKNERTELALQHTELALQRARTEKESLRASTGPHSPPSSQPDAMISALEKSSEQLKLNLQRALADIEIVGVGVVGVEVVGVEVVGVEVVGVEVVEHPPSKKAETTANESNSAKIAPLVEVSKKKEAVVQKRKAGADKEAEIGEIVEQEKSRAAGQKRKAKSVENVEQPLLKKAKVSNDAPTATRRAPRTDVDKNKEVAASSSKALPATAPLGRLVANPRSQVQKQDQTKARAAKIEAEKKRAVEAQPPPKTKPKPTVLQGLLAEIV